MFPSIRSVSVGFVECEVQVDACGQIFPRNTFIILPHRCREVLCRGISVRLQAKALLLTTVGTVIYCVPISIVPP